MALVTFTIIITDTFIIIRTIIISIIVIKIIIMAFNIEVIIMAFNIEVIMAIIFIIQY